ncbi:unnamed protein product, partial [Rotaria sordida]
MGQHSEALSYYEKALNIHQTTFLRNRTDSMTFSSNITNVYEKVGEHSKAFSLTECAHNAVQCSRPVKSQ